MPTMIIPFYLKDHLIIVDVLLGSQNVKLALDSGSKSNLIYDLELRDTNYQTKQIYVVGVDQNKILSQKIMVASTTIKSANFQDMEYVLSQVSKDLVRQVRIDGLLGGNFLNQWERWAINYKKQEIYLWR